MRTSLKEIKRIEGYLHRNASAEDELLFEANLALDPGLRQKIRLQQKAYGLIKKYGRQQLRLEIESVHQKLFHGHGHQGFRQKILNLFSP